MDRFSLVGLGLGLVTVFATQWVEGGSLAVLFQAPAAVVVGLGTIGATLFSSSAGDWLPPDTKGFGSSRRSRIAVSSS